MGLNNEKNNEANKVTKVIQVIAVEAKSRLCHFKKKIKEVWWSRGSNLGPGPCNTV